MKHTGQSRHVLLLRVWVLLLLLLQPSSSSSTRARPAAAAAAAATQQQHCCIEAPAHVAKQLHSASWQPAAAHSNILQAVRENSTLQEQLPRAPEALLSRGYKGLAPAVLRNWRQLADKLNTPWSNVTVVTFGGSITGETLLIWFGCTKEGKRSALQGVSGATVLQQQLQVFQQMRASHSHCCCCCCCCCCGVCSWLH
jgi:hypothetical protein